MRRLLTAILGALVIGCGGGSEPGPTPPPPPPPPPAVPASIAIQAGDGQEGEPGKPLPTAPTVIVKDASARPVSGAVVSFTVESGGGQVAAASATTTSDGTASIVWTLGPAEGANTLLASVGSVGPARFHATGRVLLRTLIDTTTIAAAGGVATFASGGDSLSGVRLSVPASTLSGPTRFAITADRATQFPAATGVRQVGPMFVVGTDGGVFDRPVALRLPARARADEGVTAVYYDPATGAVEGLPVIGRDDSTVTIATRHFRSDQMFAVARPPASRAPSRVASAPLPWGQIRIVTLASPRAGLYGKFTTGFKPGTDDWEFTNWGTYPKPNGICAGMSVSAMYYYYALKGTLGGLNSRFDTFEALEWDNPRGEAVATLVQQSIDWHSQALFLSGLASLATSTYPYPQLVYESLALTIRQTGQPQYIALHGTAGGHAVVAYGVDNGTVNFADPNYPGLTTRTMSYAAGAFQPVSLQTNAAASADQFTEVFVVGVSSMINGAALAQAFGQLTQGTIEAAVFPTLVREYYDRTTEQWAPVPAGDRITTTHRILALRTRCTSGCTRHRPTAPASRVTTGIKDSTDVTWAIDAVDSDTAAVFVFGRGATVDSFRLSWDNFHDGASSSNLISTYVGNTILTIVTVPFIIKPAPVVSAANVDLKFTASSGSLPASTSTYVWDFGDGTAKVSKFADSVVIHRWTQPGSYTLTAELRDNQGRLLASDQTTVTIGGTFVITPKPDTTAVETDFTFIASSSGFPTSNLLFVWDFGDNTPLMVNQGDSVATHRWTATGTYTVRAELRDKQNKVLAKDSATVVVTPVFAWMIQSATITSAQLLPAGGLGPEESDTLVHQLAQNWVADLQSAHPTTGILAATNMQPGGACYGAVLIATYAGGVWVPPYQLQLPDIRGLLATCGNPGYSGSFAIGPLGNGTLAGSAQSLHPPDTIQFEGGSINATMSGKTLTGTFTALIQYSNGIGSITASFVAQQVYP
jgi:hypothetical protein